MSSGMSGAVKLMPTASKKTVASSAESSFVIISKAVKICVIIGMH